MKTWRRFLPACLMAVSSLALSTGRAATPGSSFRQTVGQRWHRFVEHPKVQSFIHHPTTQSIFVSPAEVAGEKAALSRAPSRTRIRILDRMLSHFMVLPLALEIGSAEFAHSHWWMTSGFGGVSGGLLSSLELADYEPRQWRSHTKRKILGPETPAASFLRGVYSSVGWAGLWLHFLGPAIDAKWSAIDPAASLELWLATAGVMGLGRAGLKAYHNRKHAKNAW